MDALVSIIITTYCRPVPMLLRALDSARNQTHTKLEIIVVDDSPDSFDQRDAVQAAIEQLQDDRIVYIRHEKNMGACVARNTGIAAAKGQYIMYLDDDDELLPENVERRLAVFAQNPNLGMVYSRSYIVDSANGTQRETEQQLYRGYIFDKLILSNFIGPNALVKAECFEICGMFDPAFQSAQDFDMWLRVAEKYEMDYVDAPQIKIYIHAGERISTNYAKKVQGQEALNKKFIEYLRKHKKVYALRILRLALFYRLAGNKKKAWKMLFRAIKLNPLITVEEARRFWGTVYHLIRGK